MNSIDKILHAISKARPMYKPEIIRVNISSTFMVRTLCKECGKGPDYYYSMLKPYVWKDVKNALIYSKLVKKWMTSIVSNWYMKFTPRHFKDLSDFSFRIEDKSYASTLHKTRGSDVSRNDDVIEFVGCECGATVWAFNDKSTKKQPEITNRKGRYKYPQRFVY